VTGQVKYAFTREKQLKKTCSADIQKRVYKIYENIFVSKSLFPSLALLAKAVQNTCGDNAQGFSSRPIFSKIPPTADSRFSWYLPL
jgi:hypothetical protein